MNAKKHGLFFELLQVALGKRGVLSKTPSEQEWQELFDMSEKQAVAGIAIAALEKLSQQGQKPPMDLLYEWIGLSEQVRQENLRLNKCCKQLQRKFGEAGLRSSILKGQGILSYYDESLRELRQSGDIDIFVDCGLEKALRKVESLGFRAESWDYKHAHLDIWDDVAVEMHYRVEVLLNLWKNRKLQKWFKAHTEGIFGHTENTENTEIATPTVEFNVFYILLHIYRHFLYEGVGMRQLMDYYFVLVKVRGEKLKVRDSSEYNDSVYAIREFGMERFARGVMWVMQEVFGLERKCMIAEPLESEGRFILNEVMTGGNFGHYDERINKRHKGKIFTVMAICKHNWHLLWHYPSEVIWPPIWFVWHKCWKNYQRLKGI